MRAINKLADYDDLKCLANRMVIKDMRCFTGKLIEHEVKFTWSFQRWLRWWEYSQAIIYSGVKEGETVLDIGSGDSIFPLYLAHRKCKVLSVDIVNPELVNYKKFRVATSVDEASFRFQKVDTSKDKVDAPDKHFDRVFCISVIEHLKYVDQVAMVKEAVRVLKPKGILTFSFDYGVELPRPDCKKMTDWNTIKSQIIEPSGLEIYGNKEFVTDVNFEKYSLGHTYGMLFLEKK